ncbi:MurR/RpiR family transcriptional regulator [Compostimonas suwonensis]|uniref:DNA-binding MurR/RpiR family transcriptional regulator n=1 Tax=Compostimonas suwonensis TaxID=1048394 RepID=A0A2M9BUS8_9MICO|nr:MurR/RpiR family transcriptional regulator [Compostimonas suwonensis]PJJ61697.1 DNA-binding MurR/RpiR family transcriptional regulator [Compostimonas suwonensis]
MAEQSTEGGLDSPAQQPGTVAARIRAAMEKLSTKERQVARAILSQYPAAGLETTQALSELAKVSGPTVVRFVARLGYSSYREFQSDLRHELLAKTASPVTLEPLYDDSGTTDSFRSSALGIFQSGLTETFKDLPESELEKAFELLSNTDLTLHLVGGRFSRILAENAELNLRQMRGGVHYYRDTREIMTGLVGFTRKDCLIVFDFRRYQADTIAMARLAREKRAQIILLTDPWMSPIAEVADVVLSARVEAPSPFDGFVAPMAVVETLIAGVHKRLGASARERMLRLDEASSRIETGT